MNSIYVANAFKQTQLAWINMQLRSYTCKRKPFVLKGTSSCPASATREEHQFSQTMDGHTWHVRSTFVEVVSDASSTSGTECRRSRSEPPSEVGRLTPTPMNSWVTPVLADITNTVDARPPRWADMTDANLAIWLRGMAPRIAGVMNPVPVASQQEPEMEPEPESLHRPILLSTWPFE